MMMMVNTWLHISCETRQSRDRETRSLLSIRTLMISLGHSWGLVSPFYHYSQHAPRINATFDSPCLTDAHYHLRLMDRKWLEMHGFWYFWHSIEKHTADRDNERPTNTSENFFEERTASHLLHVRSFKQIRSSIDDGMAVSVASALVSSLLDQVNSILYGAASKHINRIQRIQNALVESLPISIHTLLHSNPLHYSKTSTGYPLNGEYISNWPPWHIRHCTLASHLTCPNCYSIMNPHGLCDLPLLFNSCVPPYKLEFGSRAFRISAPKMWNLLPASRPYP